MQAVFIIDFEMFDQEQIEKIAQFRRTLPPAVPVYWTITEHDSTKPTLKDGFYAGRDRLFVKPDLNSWLDTAVDENGEHLTDVVITAGITKGFMAGGTFYGCVMGACANLDDLNIPTVIMQDLTDYHKLRPDDHEEAAEQWANYNLPVTDSRNVLAVLQRQHGPSAPGF